MSGLHGSSLGRNIRVPDVHWEFTSERVLTMERVHGVRIDGRQGNPQERFRRHRTGEGAAVLHLRGRPAARPVPRRPARRQPARRRRRAASCSWTSASWGRIDPRTRWLLRELVYALLVKKDHATAGKIVVLLGAVGATQTRAGSRQGSRGVRPPPLTLKTLGDMSYAEIGKQLSTLADAYDVKLPRELVLIGKQFLYVERYMKLLAPKWQMMNDPAVLRVLRQLHGRGQPRAPERRRGLMEIRTGTAPESVTISRSTSRTWATQATRRYCSSWGWAPQLLLWRNGFCEKLVDQGPPGDPL